MPIIKSVNYKPPFFLFNGHLQTIYPSLFRSIKVNYTRERIKTNDGDFIDLDWKTINNSKKLVILSHGLEGDTHRQYVTGMVKALDEKGFDILAWNYRGCSGEINLIYKLYHSGSSDDLQRVIDHVLKLKKYDEIYLIGFSLGGNITLKFIGEQGKNINNKIKKGVAISVPCHLASAAIKMAAPSNKIYMRRFLKQLKKKIVLKQGQFPDKINLKDYHKIKNFYDFDGRYTAPIHGFKDADYYYSQASSFFYLKEISIPTLILNAKNDPFLSAECFPYSVAENSDFLFLEAPNNGGHCGFPFKEIYSFAEKRAVEWFE